MPDETLVMIPGPTPVVPRILEALGRPTSSHVAPAFVETYRGCLADLKRIAFTESAHPFVVAGSGTLAMEMALVNLVAPGERILVVSQGFFGDRWTQLAQAFGIEVDPLQAEWGTAVTPEELQHKLEAGSYTAVAMTHVDTSTGTAAPIEAYCELLRGRDEMLLLDGVCATAGMAERLDDWGLDVLLTGAQKAFGTPPGVAILLVSERGMERRKGRSSVPAYTADLLRWAPIMENPGLYFSTPPVNLIVALSEAMKIMLEEGMEQRFARHARSAKAIRTALDAVGLECFTSPEHLADTLSVMRYPEGVDDAKFRTEMATQGVIVAGALGPIAGQAFRLGHMGNIGVPEVTRALQAIETSLIRSGRKIEPGRALEAARDLL